MSSDRSANDWREKLLHCLLQISARLYFLTKQSFVVGILLSWSAARSDALDRVENYAHTTTPVSSPLGALEHVNLKAIDFLQTGKQTEDTAVTPTTRVKSGEHNVGVDSCVCACEFICEFVCLLSTCARWIPHTPGAWKENDRHVSYQFCTGSCVSWSL